MTARRMNTSTIERAALALGAAAIVWLVAVTSIAAVSALGPFANTPSDATASARRRLESARAMLDASDDGALARFDTMIASLEAGIPGDTPDALAPWLVRARAARAGTNERSELLASVEGALLALDRLDARSDGRPEWSEQLDRTATAGAVVLIVLAVAVLAVAITRARALRRELAHLLGDATLASSEKALADRVALLVIGRRAPGRTAPAVVDREPRAAPIHVPEPPRVATGDTPCPRADFAPLGRLADLEPLWAVEDDEPVPCENAPDMPRASHATGSGVV